MALMIVATLLRSLPVRLRLVRVLREKHNVNAWTYLLFVYLLLLCQLRKQRLYTGGEFMQLQLINLILKLFNRGNFFDVIRYCKLFQILQALGPNEC